MNKTYLTYNDVRMRLSGPLLDRLRDLLAEKGDGYLMPGDVFENETERLRYLDKVGVERENKLTNEVERLSGLLVHFRNRLAIHDDAQRAAQAREVIKDIDALGLGGDPDAGH